MWKVEISYCGKFTEIKVDVRDGFTIKKTRTISEINYREISNGSLNTIQNHLFHIQRIKKSIQMYW